MTGRAWMYSGDLDDEDLAFMQHEYVSFRMAREYYHLGEKPVVRLARLANATYKVGKKVLIRRSIFEKYMRDNIVGCFPRVDEYRKGAERLCAK